ARLSLHEQLRHIALRQPLPVVGHDRSHVGGLAVDGNLPMQGLEQGVEVAACSTNRYEPGPLLGSLAESPMPIRSGAMQRPSGCRYGNMLRQRYDEVGLPCSNTMGSPSPTSTYAISLPRTCRCFFWNGNAAEILFASDTAETMFPSPVVADCHRRAHVPTTIV